MKLFQCLALAAGLLALYLVGLGFRRAAVELQYGPAGRTLPFTLESALYFRRIQQVLRDGGLPARDPAIQYPEGIVNARTYTLGAEYVYAAVSRRLPDVLTLTDKLRWIEAGWFCLGIPALALWMGWLTGSAGAGWVAGLFYAVMLASVVRSTGQELSHENFAIPFLLVHLAAGAGWRRWAGRPVRRAGAWLISVIGLAGAVAFWDLMQFYLLLWMLASAFRCATGAWAKDPEARRWWAVHYGVLAGVGALHPYLRGHGFLCSPAMALGLALLIHLALTRWRPGGLAAIRWAVPLALLPVLGWLGSQVYTDSYGHFLELLWAKLRHRNVKPDDPAVLTFAQRIMWVPALHSANWPLTVSLMPAILPLTIISSVVLLARSANRLVPDAHQLIFFCGVSLAAFCLFFRFHVFLAIFAAGLMGIWVFWGLRQRGYVRVLALGSVLVGLALEAGQTVGQAARWGRSNVYPGELSELALWFRSAPEPPPVLANFGVSAFIAAYGGCPVILHPKFEDSGLRDRVKRYGELLFKENEESFRDWADDHGALYYVHAMGEFSPLEPRYQMRYFVNALEPPADAPARRFEFAPDDLRYFRPVFENRKYRVFDLLTRAEEVEARMFSEQARAEFEQGDLESAERLAARALAVDERQPEAGALLRKIAGLRDKGFSYQADESN
jgi:hypothetical protein